jgi:hypothetical protein
VRASVRINVWNLLDANRVVYRVSATDGSFRYLELFNAPRKLGITTSLAY